MPRSKKSMDGNTAAAHVAYAFTEVAGIYPSPRRPMADMVDQWSAARRRTSSEPKSRLWRCSPRQVPPVPSTALWPLGCDDHHLYGFSGPAADDPEHVQDCGRAAACVFHVSARTVASHALNIFGDHSDVYACRQTGFAMLAESNPQEVMDLAPVAHLTAIEGRVPFVNFFEASVPSRDPEDRSVGLRRSERNDRYGRGEGVRDHALNPSIPPCAVLTRTGRYLLPAS